MFHSCENLSTSRKQHQKQLRERRRLASARDSPITTRGRIHNKDKYAVFDSLLSGDNNRVLSPSDGSFPPCNTYSDQKFTVSIKSENAYSFDDQFYASGIPSSSHVKTLEASQFKESQVNAPASYLPSDKLTKEKLQLAPASPEEVEELQLLHDAANDSSPPTLSVTSANSGRKRVRIGSSPTLTTKTRFYGNHGGEEYRSILQSTPTSNGNLTQKLSSDTSSQSICDTLPRIDSSYGNIDSHKIETPLTKTPQKSLHCDNSNYLHSLSPGQLNKLVRSPVGKKYLQKSPPVKSKHNYENLLSHSARDSDNVFSSYSTSGSSCINKSVESSPTPEINSVMGLDWENEEDIDYGDSDNENLEIVSMKPFYLNEESTEQPSSPCLVDVPDLPANTASCSGARPVMVEALNKTSQLLRDGQLTINNSPPNNSLLNKNILLEESQNSDCNDVQESMKYIVNNNVQGNRNLLSDNIRDGISRDDEDGYTETTCLVVNGTDADTSCSEEDVVMRIGHKKTRVAHHEVSDPLFWDSDADDAEPNSSQAPSPSEGVWHSDDDIDDADANSSQLPLPAGADMEESQAAPYYGDLQPSSPNGLCFGSSQEVNDQEIFNNSLLPSEADTNDASSAAFSFSRFGAIQKFSHVKLTNEEMTTKSSWISPRDRINNMGTKLSAPRKYPWITDEDKPDKGVLPSEDLNRVPQIEASHSSLLENQGEEEGVSSTAFGSSSRRPSGQQITKTRETDAFNKLSSEKSCRDINDNNKNNFKKNTKHLKEQPVVSVKNITQDTIQWPAAKFPKRLLQSCGQQIAPSTPSDDHDDHPPDVGEVDISPDVGEADIADAVKLRQRGGASQQQQQQASDDNNEQQLSTTSPGKKSIIVNIFKKKSAHVAIECAKKTMSRKNVVTIKQNVVVEASTSQVGEGEKPRKMFRHKKLLTNNQSVEVLNAKQEPLTLVTEGFSTSRSASSNSSMQCSSSSCSSSGRIYTKASTDSSHKSSGSQGSASSKSSSSSTSPFKTSKTSPSSSRSPYKDNTTSSSSTGCKEDSTTTKPGGGGGAETNIPTRQSPVKNDASEFGRQIALLDDNFTREKRKRIPTRRLLESFALPSKQRKLTDMLPSKPKERNKKSNSSKKSKKDSTTVPKIILSDDFPSDEEDLPDIYSGGDSNECNQSFGSLPGSDMDSYAPSTATPATGRTVSSLPSAEPATLQAPFVRTNPIQLADSNFNTANSSPDYFADNCGSISSSNTKTKTLHPKQARSKSKHKHKQTTTQDNNSPDKYGANIKQPNKITLSNFSKQVGGGYSKIDKTKKTTKSVQNTPCFSNDISQWLTKDTLITKKKENEINRKKVSSKIVLKPKAKSKNSSDITNEDTHSLQSSEGSFNGNTTSLVYNDETSGKRSKKITKSASRKASSCDTKSSSFDEAQSSTNNGGRSSANDFGGQGSANNGGPEDNYEEEGENDEEGEKEGDLFNYSIDSWGNTISPQKQRTATTEDTTVLLEDATMDSDAEGEGIGGAKRILHLGSLLCMCICVCIYMCEFVCVCNLHDSRFFSS